MNNLINKPYALWREGNLWYGWAFVGHRYIFNDLGIESVTDLIVSLHSE